MSLFLDVRFEICIVRRAFGGSSNAFGASVSMQSISQMQKRHVVLLDFEIVHLDRHDPFSIKHIGRETCFGISEKK